jgi:hypothetical protein
MNKCPMYNMLITEVYIPPLRFLPFETCVGYLPKVPLDLMYVRDVDVNEERTYERARKFILLRLFRHLGEKNRGACKLSWVC